MSQFGNDVQTITRQRSEVQIPCSLTESSNMTQEKVPKQWGESTQSFLAADLTLSCSNHIGVSELRPRRSSANPHTPVRCPLECWLIRHEARAGLRSCTSTAP